MKKSMYLLIFILLISFVSANNVFIDYNEEDLLTNNDIKFNVTVFNGFEYADIDSVVLYVYQEKELLEQIFTKEIDTGRFIGTLEFDEEGEYRIQSNAKYGKDILTTETNIYIDKNNKVYDIIRNGDGQVKQEVYIIIIVSILLLLMFIIFILKLTEPKKTVIRKRYYYDNNYNHVR